MKVVGIIQMTKEDLFDSDDASNYCVGVAKSSKIFDDIIIACPSGDHILAIEPYAKKWEVKIIEGDIDNVASRLLLAAEQTKADIIVRLLARQFYLDTDQLLIMINELTRQDGDYVVLPDEYNYALVGDTFKKSALQKAVHEIHNIDNITTKNTMAFSPFIYMEENPKKFKHIHVSCGPKYDTNRTKLIKEKYLSISKENQIETSSSPVSSYSFLIDNYINKDWKIVDVSCGKGRGASLLSKHCSNVLGIDLNKEFIDSAKEKYKRESYPNLLFKIDNAESFSIDRAVDAIVSIHTMEHLTRPDLFLQSIHKNLIKNGMLFLEVPLAFPEPMNEPLLPWHVKEYDLQELYDFTLKNGFKISRVYVKKRHLIENVPITNNILNKPKGKLTAALLIGSKISK